MTTIAAETIGPARLVAVGIPEQPPLCGLLVDAGKLESSDVDRALRLQREQEDWERIGSILVKLGLVSEKDVAESLSSQLHLELVDRGDYSDERPGGTTVTERFLKKSKALILDEDDDTLSVVLADPLDQYVIDALKLRSGKDVTTRLGVPSEIEHALERLFNGKDGAGNGAATDIGAAQYLDDVEQLKELAGEAPVIKLVNQLIQKAAECGASDIHIEPFEGQLKVRYRVHDLVEVVFSEPSAADHPVGVRGIPLTPEVAENVQVIGPTSPEDVAPDHAGRRHQAVVETLVERHPQLLL
jgi:general secretion pathway protein E